MTSSLADRLRLAMQGPPKVTQVALAKACGIKPPSVAGWLSGKTKTLEASNLLAASKLLRVNPDWLASNKGPMRIAPSSRAEEPMAVYTVDASAYFKASTLLRQLTDAELSEATTFMEWQLSKRHNPGNGHDIPVAA